MEIPPELLAAKGAIEWSILALPGVVGVGIGMREENGDLFEELAVRVYVADRSAIPAGIPEIVGDVGVCIVEGVVEPAVEDTDPYNPLVGGIRIAQPSRGAGTLGAIVQDASTGELLGLSCFHVVGDTSAVFPNTIWQPREPNLVVGGFIPPDDNIGRVVRVDFPQTPPLPFSPVLAGLVDAAVITLVPALNQGRDLSSNIAGQFAPAILLDRVTATALPIAGRPVRKRGFVTRVTEGKIIDANLTVQWTAGPPNSYLIEQAEIAGASSNPGGMFCDKGDSGAVVLEMDSATAVGLLWGKRLGGLRGIMSHIRNVESQLGVNVAWA
jgi:hypothetical protein